MMTWWGRVAAIAVVSVAAVMALAGDAEQEARLERVETWYRLGRARPWSTAEPMRIRAELATMQHELETAGAAESAALRDRVASGIRQAEAQIDARAGTLGGWSPWFAAMVGADAVLCAPGSAPGQAALRAVSALVEGGGLEAVSMVTPVVADVDARLGAGVAEAVVGILDAHTGGHALGGHDLGTALFAGEQPGRPADIVAVLRGVAEDFRREGMTVTDIAVVRVDPVQSVDRVARVRARLVTVDPATGVAVTTAWADGLAEASDARARWLPVLALLLASLLPWISAAVLRSSALDPDRSLATMPRPPAWSGGFAVVAGYGLALLVRMGLIAASPDLMLAADTPAGLAWMLGLPVAFTVLPMTLVYVLSSRLRALATRLANTDTIATLLGAGWLAALGLLGYVAGGAGGVGAGLVAVAPSMLAGVAALIVIAHRWNQWTALGDRTALTQAVAGAAGLVAGAMLAARGTLAWSLTGALLPLLAIVVAGLAAAITRRARPSGVVVAEDGERSRIHQLREPAFIRTPRLGGEFERLLEHAVGDDAEDAAMEVIGITGARGAGKTRLARELARAIAAAAGERGLADEVRVLFGDCAEPGDPAADVPYGPLRDALADLMGVNRFGNPAENARRLQSGLQRLAAAGPLVGSAISVALDLAGDDDDQLQVANEAALADEMVEVMKRTVLPSAERPRGGRLVLILDDIHWLDGESERLVGMLVERLVALFTTDKDLLNRVLMVFTWRTDVDPASAKRAARFAEMMGRLQQQEKVNLAMLEGLDKLMVDDAETDAWLEALFASLRATDRARRAIGSSLATRQLVLPLHRLEFLTLAYEYGALRDVEGRLDLARDGDLSAVGAGRSFEEMVQREFAGLDPRLVEVLHCCAVIGTRFRVSLVARIFGYEVLELLMLLREAEERGIVRDVLDADDIYEFQDKRIAGAARGAGDMQATGVVQMVREYHLRYVRIREEELAAGHMDEDGVPFDEVMSMAHHAGIVAERLPLSAIRWGLLAAGRCELRHLPGRGLDRLEPARLLVVDGRGFDLPVEHKLDVLETHARLVLAADRDAGLALDSSRRARSLMSATGHEDPVRSARLMLLEAEALYRARQFDEIGPLCQEIRGADHVPVEVDLRAEFYAILALDPRAAAAEKHARLGRLLSDVMAAGDALPVVRLESEVLTQHGLSCLWHAGDLDEAARSFERALDLNRRPEIADRKGEAIALGGLGDVWRKRASDEALDDDQRRAMLEHARASWAGNLAISRDTGDVAGIVRMTSQLAALLLDQAVQLDGAARAEAVEQARVFYDESFELSLGERRWMGARFAFQGLLRCEGLDGAGGAILEESLQRLLAASVDPGELAEIRGGLEKVIAERRAAGADATVPTALMKRLAA